MLLSHAANPSTITPLIAVSSSPTHLVVGSSTSSLGLNHASQPRRPITAMPAAEKACSSAVCSTAGFFWYGFLWPGSAPRFAAPASHSCRTRISLNDYLPLSSSRARWFSTTFSSLTRYTTSLSTRGTRSMWRGCLQISSGQLRQNPQRTSRLT